MPVDQEYSDLIQTLRKENSDGPVRKKHRLPAEYYAASDYDFFFTIHARQSIIPFTNASLATKIIESLLWRKNKHDWTLYCYCLMPDHLHFVLRLPPSDDERMNGGARGTVPKGVLDQIGDFKKYTTTQVWWKHGGQGQLWQKSSYDCIIWYNKSVESAVRYVLNNPVRRGLVEKWQDYPFSGIVDPW